MIAPRQGRGNLIIDKCQIDVLGYFRLGKQDKHASRKWSGFWNSTKKLLGCFCHFLFGYSCDVQNAG
jgi:hypothetical protein